MDFSAAFLLFLFIGFCVALLVLSGFVEGYFARPKTPEKPAAKQIQPERNQEEEKLVDEIVERQIKLNRIRKSRMLPVRRLQYDMEFSVYFAWAFALVTLAIAAFGIIYTQPWSTGMRGTIREAIAWILGLTYLFVPGFPVLDPFFESIRAFKTSPDKLRDLPPLLIMSLPAVIGLGSVAAFYYGYLGRHY